MRVLRPAVLLWLAVTTAMVTRAQSTSPVLSQSFPAQTLAPGGPAITVDLRNYFAVPGLGGGPAPAPYTSVFPTGGGTPLITLEVQNSSPGNVETLLSGSTLTLTPVAPGSATITARATDPNGASAAGAFAVTVFSSAPVFTNQPRSQTVATGSTVVFAAPATGAGAYRWEKNGEVIASATSSTLVITSAAAGDAARYTVFATNALGSTAADTATLQVVDIAPELAGRITNLSILTLAGAGERILTVGAVVGPLNSSGTLPLVLRGVGPTLAQAPFNVDGVLPDPVMTLFAAGSNNPVASNDDWGGGEPMRAAFEAVGAFALPTSSVDSALLRNGPGVAVGGHTVQVTGKGGVAGLALAEIYDAAGTTRTAATPRLINVSTLTRVDAGADLAVGFVIVGQTARTVLVRGVGPSLARLGVGDVMADPKLDLFDNTTGGRIGANDDWAGALEISNAGAVVGAFALAGGTSKDAALLVTLPPGPYSARVASANGEAGTVIVEVYEVR